MNNPRKHRPLVWAFSAFALLFMQACSDAVVLQLSATTTVDESVGTVSITAQLNRPLRKESLEPGVGDPSGYQDVNVDYTVSGTSTSADHSLVSGTFTIPGGQTTETLDIAVTDDTLDENDETVIVTFSPSAEATIDGDSDFTITIEDNDVPSTIQLTETTSIHSEFVGTVNVEVSLDKASSFDVSVPFTVTGTASNPGDHDLAAGTATVSAGDTTTNISFTVVNADPGEGQETVIITLGSPTNGTIGSNTVHTVTITDTTELPTVNFTAASQTVAEGVGTFTINMTQNVTSNVAVTVPYTITGTSGALDHDLVDGNFSIAAGDLADSVTVTVSQDTIDEDASETAISTMGAPTNGQLGATTVHTVTITDDDDPPTANFSAASASVGEAAGSTNITVNLSNESINSVTVPYIVSGTASNPADHDLAAGNIIVTAGNTSNSATVNIVSDDDDENNETVIATMGTVTNGSAGSTNVHTLTITDDDAQPTVSWSAASQNPGEASGAVTVTANLNTDSGLDVTIPYTISGTATNPDDHDAADGSLSITAGNTTNNFNFNLSSDALDEFDETVIVTMGTVTNATKGTDVQTITIADDDAQPTIQWNATNVFASEASPPTTATLVLDAASGRDITVTYDATTGVAVPPADFDLSPTTGNFVMTAGNTSLDVNFNIEDDGDTEGVEVGHIDLGTADYATIGATLRSRIVITDNDKLLTGEKGADAVSVARFGSSLQTINEASGSKGIPVVLSAPSKEPVTFNYTISGTADANDHTLRSGEATFEPGQTLMMLPFQTLFDGIVEEMETLGVSLTHRTVKNSRVTANLSHHTVRIFDVDSLREDPGLKLWLDSGWGLTKNEGRIEEWNDLSMEQNDLQQYTTVSQPGSLSENKHGPVLFDGRKDELNTLLPLSEDEEVEFVLAVYTKDGEAPRIGGMTPDEDWFECTQKANVEESVVGLPFQPESLDSDHFTLGSYWQGGVYEMMIGTDEMEEDSMEAALKYLLSKYRLSQEHCLELDY